MLVFVDLLMVIIDLLMLIIIDLYAAPPPPMPADGHPLCECPTPRPEGAVPQGDPRQWRRLARLHIDFVKSIIFYSRSLSGWSCEYGY